MSNFPRFFRNAYLFHISAATLVLTSTVPGTTEAATLDMIEARDFNKNGIIENGPEREALRDILDQLDENQFQLVINDDEYRNTRGVAVAAFDPQTYQKRIEARCNVPKRFFLQDSVSSVSVLNPGLTKTSKNGATFSVTEDHKTDETSWSAEGALFYIPRFSKRCSGDSRLANRELGFVSGYAFAPFIFFDGEGSDTNNSTSALQLGIKSEVQIFGGPFDVQHISLNPFFQTDFDFDAEIYGVSASWKPVHLDSHLNGFVESERLFQPSWTFTAVADYRTVEKAGSSGLVAGTEYGWFGAIIGASVDIAPKNANPLYAKVEYHAFRDVINDVNATRFVGELGLFLSEDKRTALTLKYENGENYMDLTDEDRTTLAFKLAF